MALASLKKYCALLMLIFITGFSSLSFAQTANSEEFDNFISTYDGTWVSDNYFVYSQSLLDFKTADFIETEMPELSEHSEVISNFTGSLSISPKIALALIRMAQNGVASPFDANLPNTADAANFADKLEAMLRSLHEAFHRYRGENPSQSNPGSLALVELFLGTHDGGDFANSTATIEAQFQSTIEVLFPADTNNRTTPGFENTLSAVNLEADYLSLPWPVGDSWWFGGVHSFTGGEGPMSSLDFVGSFQSWGDDTTPYLVTAAQDGVVSVYSSCNVRITDTQTGYATSYYHLDNVQVTDGQLISKGDVIANYADNLQQAICQGGHSTGPHVHFSLLLNGVHISLLDVELSGYVVHPGRYSYDADPMYMWLTKDGAFYYAWQAPIINEQAEEGPPVATTLITPNASISNNTPTYVWNAIEDSTWYYLWVNDETGTPIKQWYTDIEANCNTSVTCSVTPSQTISGNASWWVSTWNSFGSGPWSTVEKFSVVPPEPPAATLLTPEGNIAVTQPTFSWNAVPTATWYYLWVSDSIGIPVRTWFRAADVGCASGTGVCSTTPTQSIAGNSTWWIRTWNNGGYGPWSSSKSFTPAVATISTIESN